MSDGPIKPEDIPQELIDWHLQSYVADSWADALAERLNKAIELGVVSPPCRILRSKFGTLYHDMLFPSDCEAQSSAWPGDSSEHWRGQAE